MRLRGTCSLVAVMVIAVGLVSAGLVVPRVDANIVAIETANGGFVIPSSEEVQMPTANVSIKVLVTGSFVYGISANCSFELFAESAANCSIAFAFPKAWLLESGVGSTSQDIYVDNVMVPHSLVEWEDLSSDLQVNVTEPTLEQCSYDVFNTTFGEHQTRIVDVHTTLDITSHGEYFLFRYAVGSGKYWTGQTNETVTIEVDDQAGLASLRFSPTPSILENVSATVKAATWYIQVDAFPDFWVALHARQIEHEYPQDPWGVLFGGVALLMIVFVIACPRRRWPIGGSGAIPMDKTL